MRIIKYVLKMRISEDIKKIERIENAQAEENHIETGGTMRAQFITASEVAEIMGISRSKAYQIVREMNRELKSQGYLTVAGKCPAQYFKQKFYGFQIPGGERNGGK